MLSPTRRDCDSVVFVVYCPAETFPDCIERAHGSILKAARDKGYEIFSAALWEAPRVHDMNQVWCLGMRAYAPNRPPTLSTKTITVDIDYGAKETQNG